MGRDSGIAWTHHTFNPWWGCEKVSPGCKEYRRQTQGQRSELLRQLNELGW